jgi:hypothetical protein
MESVAPIQIGSFSSWPLMVGIPFGDDAKHARLESGFPMFFPWFSHGLYYFYHPFPCFLTHLLTHFSHLIAREESRRQETGLSWDELLNSTF